MSTRSSNTTALLSSPGGNQNGIPATKAESRLGHLQAIAPKLTHMEANDVFPSRKRSLPCTAKHLGELKVELGNEALWKVFHDEEHEMKATNKGRPLFPILNLKLSGLSPTEMYNLTVKFANVDSARYRYCPVKNEWFRWCETQSDPTTNGGRRLYEHPSSPALGAVWTAGVITFDKLRLTNNRDKTEQHVIQVSSLRKYRIQVIVTKPQCAQCHQPHVRMVELPLTEFIAVTGYRSNKMKQLKIDKNPFAVAFRDDYRMLRASRKRKNEVCDMKRSCKIFKVDDVAPTSVKPRNYSWEESLETSCCKPDTLTQCCAESPDSLTSCCRQSPDSLATPTSSIVLDNHVSAFLQNDVIHYPQNDLILYPQFHQPLYSYYDDVNQSLDIPQFEIPDISTQYPGLIQPQEQCTCAGELIEVDQSYCYKYEDFTSPFQYTEWDTVYY